MGADPYTQLLIRSVADKSSTKRIDSIDALGAMRCVEACECLGDALTDNSPLVRICALCALKNIGEPAYPQILDGLLFGPTDVRDLAALFLGQIGNIEAIAPLILATKDEDNAVRFSSTRALGSLGADQELGGSIKDRLIDALSRNLKDPEPDVQEAAKKALIKVRRAQRDAVGDSRNDDDALLENPATNDLSHVENAPTENGHYAIKECERCYSLFKAQKRDASEEFCDKCRRELEAAVRAEQSGDGQRDKLQATEKALLQAEPLADDSLRDDSSDGNARVESPSGEILGTIKQAQETEGTLQDKAHAELQSQADNTKSVEFTEGRSDSAKCAEDIQDGINDVSKRREILKHESEISAGHVPIQKNEAAIPVSAVPSASEPNVAANATERKNCLRCGNPRGTGWDKEGFCNECGNYLAGTAESWLADQVKNGLFCVICGDPLVATQKVVCRKNECIHKYASISQKPASLEASGRPLSIIESGEGQLASELAQLDVSLQKRCQRCGSVLESHGQDASKILCHKCINEQNAALDAARGLKTCVYCKKKFKPKNENQRLCSRCSSKAGRETRSEREELVSPPAMPREGPVVVHEAEPPNAERGDRAARQCEYCKKEFKPHGKTQRFCSPVCLVRSKAQATVHKSCLRCGLKFESAVDEELCKQCNFELNNVAYLLNKGINRKVCERCEKEYYPTGLNQRFCSRSCSSNARHEARSQPEELVPPPAMPREGPIVVHEAEPPNAERGDRAARQCEYCKKEFTPQDEAQRFCSPICLANSSKAGNETTSKRDEPVRRTLMPNDDIMDVRPTTQILIKRVMDISSNERVESIDKLGAMRCVEACECLANALKDEDQQVRICALNALENIGTPAYPQIIHALIVSSADVRQLAAEVLGRMNKKEAVSPLTAALRDQRKLVRLSAVRALGNFSTNGAIRALISGLKDPDWDVRRAAKIALIKAGSLACDSLRDACDDRDALIQKSAAEILNKIEQGQKIANVQQEGAYAEVQSQVDETENRAEVDTKIDSDSVENLAESVQIPMNAVSKTVPSTPSPSEAHTVVNVTELPTSIRLEASTTNPLINESVKFTVTLTAGNTPLSKPVTIWHTWEGIRYDDVTNEPPFTLAKTWDFAAVRHYCATFAGDDIHAASTSAVLDINVGTRTFTETAVTLESSTLPSISESDAELPTPSAESLLVDETSRAAQPDDAKNRAEVDTKVDSDSVENHSKVIQDRINDALKRSSTPGHESEVITERAQIPISEVSKTAPSTSSPSEPDSVVNFTGVHTGIKLEASNTNPVVHEAVTFTVTLTAYTQLSKSVTIWHTLSGVRYNDITMESTCAFTQNWDSAAVRHYYVTFAGDATFATSTSAVLDINVSARAPTETAVTLEASNTHLSVREPSALPPAPTAQSLTLDETSKQHAKPSPAPQAQPSLSPQITCLRCDSVLESHEEAATEVLCVKCLSELSAAATDVTLGVRTCLYCGKKFKPDHVSNLTGFCSASCSAKALSQASTEQYKVISLKSAAYKGPDVVNVEKESPAELVGSSAQRVVLSEEANWSYETFLSKRVAQYDGQYAEIAASAVPFYKLLCDLLDDELIDWHAKIMISSALGYLVLADDVIPDHTEYGLIDDVYVMAHVLHELLDQFSEEITRNWHSEKDIFAVIDLTHSACHELVQSQSFEILQKVGLHKFQDLELEEYSGSYQARLAKVAREKRELLGLLAYIMRQVGFKKVDRSSVKKIRDQIERSGDAAEIHRIIELAKKDHDIKIEDKEFEDFKEEYEREMNETMWK